MRLRAMGWSFGLMLAAIVAASAQPVSDWPFSDRWDPLAGRRDAWRPERMGPQQKIRTQRHQTYMTAGVPAPYRGVINPEPATAETIAAGATLYAAHCSGCHGATGYGDGDLGRSLEPSPALLSFMVRMPMAVDEYLLWTISEGGASFGSEMPAFKSKLETDEIWRVIAFMRAGFPQGAR